jgi:hypothetical protein
MCYNDKSRCFCDLIVIKCFVTMEGGWDEGRCVGSFYCVQAFKASPVFERKKMRKGSA